jgi:hypothetical protein
MILPLPDFADSPARVLRWRVELVVDGQSSIYTDADLLEPPRILRELRLTRWPTPRAVRTAEAILLLRDAETLFMALSQERLRGSGRLFLQTRDGDVELLHGTIGSVEHDGKSWRVRLSETFPRGDSPLCRRLSLLGRVVRLPVVFGRAVLELLPLFDAPRARLRLELSTGSETCELSSPVDWPAVGRVQVQDELIGYTAITNGGRTLGGLTRSAPRGHRAGAAVALLPLDEDPAWCIAGHEASLDSLHADAGATRPLGTEGVGVETLAGANAAVLRRPLIPLTVRHGLAEQVALSPLGTAGWSLDDDATSALDPSHAITFGAPLRGAVLTPDASIWAADYAAPAEIGPNRFDLLLGASLVLEYSNSPNWELATRLRIRVIKGEVTRVLDVGGEGAYFDHGLTLDSSLDPTLLGEPPTDWRPVSFEAIDPSGPWSGAPFAIDGRGDTHAWIDSEDPAALVARGPASPGAGAPTHLRLTTRVRSREESLPTEVCLRIRSGTELDEEQVFEVAADSTSDLQFEVPLPSEWDESTSDPPEFLLELPEGGWVEVSLLRGEIGRRPIAAAPTSAMVPVQATGSVTLGGNYHQARIDLTDLLDPDNPDSLLAGDLRVELELIDPPYPGWLVFVRGLRWEKTVLPANGVALETRLWGTVRGLACREDGTANPAEAIRALLTRDEFGQLPDQELDETTFPIAAATCDEREIAFAAVFRGAETLGEAAAGAVGESTLVLRRELGRWRLNPEPVILQPSEAEELAARLVLDHPPLRSVTAGPDPLPIEPRWAVRGVDVLATRAGDREPPAGRSLQLTVAPELLGTDVGTGLQTPSIGTLGSVGEVVRVEWNGRDLVILLAAVR